MRTIQSSRKKSVETSLDAAGRSACATLLICLAVSAQQIGHNTSSKEDSTFKASTQLVVETVVVKDKSGNPVEGLTAKDFTITENGVPQTIKFFEYQKLQETPDAAPLTVEPNRVTLLDKLPHTQISAQTPSNTRYNDSRLLALYFDMTAMPPPDQLRALAAAQQFITKQMTSSDLMAIMTFAGGAVQVLQDFTGDRTRLLTIIRTMVVGEAEGLEDRKSVV